MPVDERGPVPLYLNSRGAKGLPNVRGSRHELWAQGEPEHVGHNTQARLAPLLGPDPDSGRSGPKPQDLRKTPRRHEPLPTTHRWLSYVKDYDLNEGHRHGRWTSRTRDDALHTAAEGPKAGLGRLYLPTSVWGLKRALFRRVSVIITQPTEKAPRTIQWVIEPRVRAQ